MVLEWVLAGSRDQTASKEKLVPPRATTFKDTHVVYSPFHGLGLLYFTHTKIIDRFPPSGQVLQQPGSADEFHMGSMSNILRGLPS